MSIDLNQDAQARGAGPTAPDPADPPGLRAAAEHLLLAVRLADQRAEADPQGTQLSAWANIAQRINLAAAGVLLHVDEPHAPGPQGDPGEADCAAALRAAARHLAAVPLAAGLGVAGTAEGLFQISRAQVEVQQLQDNSAPAGDGGLEHAGPAW